VTVTKTKTTSTTSQLSQTNPRATLCVLTLIVLQTKVDVQCDKQAAVVGRTKLTALATVDVQLRKKAGKSAKFRVWDVDSERSALIFENTRIPL